MEPELPVPTPVPLTPAIHDQDKPGDDSDLTVDTSASADARPKKDLRPLSTVLPEILADDPPAPYEYVPCANVNSVANSKCVESGTSRCSGCALVCYCSEKCQREHWKQHKRDCRNPIRSKNWSPRWTRERRIPWFDDENVPGRNLWSNIPALDALNLTMNEGAMAVDRDFSIAYAGSGDIRNVIRTVNALPNDYSGQLTVLLNDLDGVVVARNLLLLAVLGSIENHSHAAEIALHLWYSAFIPETHITVLHRIILDIIGQMVEGDSFSLQLFEQHMHADSFYIKLGEHSMLKGALARLPGIDNPALPNFYSALPHLMDFMEFVLRLKNDNKEEIRNEASKSMQNVRFDPSRADFHDLRNCYLEDLSHRLADFKFRKSGIVLPFGAAESDFSIPNQTMFSKSGKWLPKDTANPLGAWNIEDVISTGQAHGAQREDLYGCLYFYLSDQLRTFAERVKRFRITFYLVDCHCHATANDIRAGVFEQLGLPRTILFDRIDVSSVISSGVSEMLADWAPLLNNTNPHATIFGHFLDWCNGPTISESAEVVAQLYREQVFHHHRDPGTSMVLKRYLHARWDNSRLFAEYLDARRVKQAAEKSGIKLKERYTIVPRRVCTPIGGAANSLPVFQDNDAMYLNICVASASMLERFVEFCRV